MGDLYTVDGLWQRFLWVNLPVTRLPAPGDGVKFYISEMLLVIYRRLENLPAINPLKLGKYGRVGTIGVKHKN